VLPDQRTEAGKSTVADGDADSGVAEEAAAGRKQNGR
jgi:hypothetical protein